MGHWNNRVLANIVKGEEYFQIHEVYYNDEGIPNSYTKNAVSIYGEDLDAIKWQLDMMQKCLEKPILWGGDKFPQEYKTEEK